MRNAFGDTVSPKTFLGIGGARAFRCALRDPAIRNDFVNMVEEGMLQPYGRLLDQPEAQAAE